jgi:3-hydroxymyristoyl/3-hydroxydecanoyl-(acyl carrier protein) dehydratase
MEISAQIKIAENSPWFSGHFPGEPIFPGIAQLDLVAEVISEFNSNDLWIKSLSRIKFKKLIRPGDLLTVRVVDEKGQNSYSFSITVAGQQACTGVMNMAKPRLPTRKNK